jgi:hypothetical protein
LPAELQYCSSDVMNFISNKLKNSGDNAKNRYFNFKDIKKEIFLTKDDLWNVLKQGNFLFNIKK